MVIVDSAIATAAVAEGDLVTKGPHVRGKLSEPLLASVGAAAQ